MTSKIVLRYLCKDCCDKRGLSFNGMVENKVGRKNCYDCSDNSSTSLHSIMINEKKDNDNDEKEEKQKVKNPSCKISNISKRVCELGTKGCTISHGTYTKKFPYTMYFRCEEDRQKFEEIVRKSNPDMPTKMGEC